MELITDLLDLHADPGSPVSQGLAFFVMDSGLIRSVMLQNFLCNSAGRSPLTGKRRAMQLELYNRILACAAAAGFLKPKRPLSCAKSVIIPFS
jgi:hypothetical protein